MKKRVWALIFVLCLTGAAACGKDDAPPSESPPLYIDYELDNDALRVYPLEDAEYRLDGGEWGTVTTFPSLADGEHMISARRGEKEISETFVVKDDKYIDIYLIGGQSNAEGSSYWSELAEDSEYRRPVEGVKAYVSGASSPYNDRWENAVKSGMGGNESLMGPEIGMAHVLKQYYEGRQREVGIFKFAVGGTGLYDRWISPTARSLGNGTDKKEVSLRDGRRAGDLYKRFLENFFAAAAALEAEGYVPVVKGMAWMQGEADANMSDSVGIEYAENLAWLVKDLRKDLGAPDMHFVAGQIKSPTTPAEAEVIQAQKALPKRVENCSTFGTGDLHLGLVDMWHFNAEDAVVLGKRFAGMLAENCLRVPVSDQLLPGIYASEGSRRELPDTVEITDAVGARYAAVEWDKNSVPADAAGTYLARGTVSWGERTDRRASVTLPVTIGTSPLLDGKTNEKIWTEREGNKLLGGAATVKTVYDKEGIYVAFSVADGYLSSNADNAKAAGGDIADDVFYRSFDYMRIFFAAGEKKTMFWIGLQDVVSAYACGGDDVWSKNLNMNAPWRKRGFAWASNVLGTQNWASDSDEGYEAEFFVPYDFLGISESDLPRLKANFEVINASGKNLLIFSEYVGGGNRGFFDYNDLSSYVDYLSLIE